MSLAQLGVDRPQSEPNLPFHPTIVEWLDLHTSVLGGKHPSGRISKPYPAKSLPRAPLLSSTRFIPSDVPNLMEHPIIPDNWHRVVRDQSKPSLESVNLHLKDYMSLVTQSSKDLAIISDIDWLLAGGLVDRFVVEPSIR